MLVQLQVHAPSNTRKFRVVVTKDLPGDRWLQMLLNSGCQVDICKHADTILSQDIIKKLISADETHGVLGQLTEVCDILLTNAIHSCIAVQTWCHASYQHNGFRFSIA